MKMSRVEEKSVVERRGKGDEYVSKGREERKNERGGEGRDAEMRERTSGKLTEPSRPRFSVRCSGRLPKDRG